MSESVKSKVLASGKQIGFSDRLIGSSAVVVIATAERLRSFLRLANKVVHDRMEATLVADQPKSGRSASRAFVVVRSERETGFPKLTQRFGEQLCLFCARYSAAGKRLGEKSRRELAVFLRRDWI